MSGLVCFTVGDADWAVDVEHTRRVLPAQTLIPLPDPRPGVAGLLPGEGEAAPLPVLASLGDDAAGQVLELEAAGRRFGLLVGRVTGVLRAGEARIDPAPEGQDEEIVCGVVVTAGATSLLVDAEALARRVR